MNLTIAPELPPLVTDDTGTVRIRGTRIPIDTVIACYHQGLTPPQIVEQFDVLKLSDVYATIAYYLTHRAESDQYLEERRRAAEVLRREMEAKFPPEGIRTKLMARRKSNASGQ